MNTITVHDLDALPYGSRVQVRPRNSDYRLVFHRERFGWITGGTIVPAMEIVSNYVDHRVLPAAAKLSGEPAHG